MTKELKMSSAFGSPKINFRNAEKQIMSHGKFATAINCMDGRIQLPVILYLKKRYDADYVDLVTEAGPIKILAKNKDTVLLNSIKRRVEISKTRHGSQHVGIVGHHDCAGNPVSKNVQLKQIREAAKIVGKWGLNMVIVGLWVDENWMTHEVELG